MAEKIDYKEYLKQFGKIETDSKNRIKAYLEEQIKEDAALRELYRPEKIDDCYDFIKNAVKADAEALQLLKMQLFSKWREITFWIFYRRNLTRFPK